MQLGPLNTEPPTPGFEWSNVLVAITGTEFRPRRNADLGSFLQHNQRRPVLNVLTQPLLGDADETARPRRRAKTAAR